MREFMIGAIAMGSLVAALFFLRFLRQTRDRLFAFFALAFALMAANWTAMVFFRPEDEARTIVYAVRFLAFALILIAIVDKNRTVK
jgi:hypothetical protein